MRTNLSFFLLRVFIFGLIIAYCVFMTMKVSDHDYDLGAKFKVKYIFKICVMAYNAVIFYFLSEGVHV